MPVRTSYEHGVPNWVDLATTDVAAAQAFYRGLFGWEFEERPTDQGPPYMMAMRDGQPIAGMLQMPPDMEAAGVPSIWSTYVAVDDVEATVAKVPGAGGEVTVPPMQVMEAGKMAMVTDTTGAQVGLWQGQNHAGAGVVNEHGAVTWNELQTSNPKEAAEFYRDVLGWTSDTMPMGDRGDYTVFHVAPDDQGIAGATMPAMPDVPAHWSTVFATEDADATAATARELGGTVLLEPTDIPVGRFTVVADPTGAAFQAIAVNPADPA